MQWSYWTTRSVPVHSFQGVSGEAARKLMRSVSGPAASVQNAPSFSTLPFGSGTTPAEWNCLNVIKLATSFMVWFYLREEGISPEPLPGAFPQIWMKYFTIDINLSFILKWKKFWGSAAKRLKGWMSKIIFSSPWCNLFFFHLFTKFSSQEWARLWSYTVQSLCTFNRN